MSKSRWFLVASFLATSHILTFHFADHIRYGVWRAKEEFSDKKQSENTEDAKREQKAFVVVVLPDEDLSGDQTADRKWCRRFLERRDGRPYEFVIALGDRGHTVFTFRIAPPIK